MKISCPACSAKYSIADDRVLDRLAKVRCRKCGATIVIDGKATPPSVQLAQETPAPADQGAGTVEYSVDFGEGDQRTMTVKEIASAFEAGTIALETYVWTEGFPDWKVLSEVPELLQAVQASAASPQGIDSPASPWGSTGGEMPRAAARANRPASNDLFGGIEAAGSEDDGVPDVPEHPPTTTGSSSSASSASGSRNETSVLFSLSALTSQANARPSARPISTAPRDDSGLIDLKALTAAAMKNESAPVVSASPAVPAAAIAPLGPGPGMGLGSPLGGGLAGGSSGLGYTYQPQRTRWPLFIGGGLAVGLIAIAGAILLRPDPPPPPPAPIVVAAPTAEPPPAPTPAASPSGSDAAVPPATGAGPAEPAPTAAPRPQTVNRPRRVAPPSTQSTAKTQSGAPSKEAPKPAPPKSSGCGCASGDLQCAMRCAAKGK